MSFQAYIDTIKNKTGLDPADFKRLAQVKGLLDPGVKAGQIVAWLADDYGLGRGHAMALVATFTPTRAADVNADDPIGAHFGGGKARWRPVYNDLVAEVEKLGPVGIAPTRTYISLLNGKAKFAIIAVTTDRLDVGIKLKGEPTTDRLEQSGTWNSMVTHRVRLSDLAGADAELHDWLRRAYNAA
ncbi:MAG: phosphoribosylformylglycinamidine synthase [Glaciihabitans sp.]|nr:phosphoribosylformylglycinamidine synthase [Glaciihabitans sp.]